MKNEEKEIKFVVNKLIGKYVFMIVIEFFWGCFDLWWILL